MLNMTITPQRPALLEGYDNETRAAADHGRRGAYASDTGKVIEPGVVIDRSGSMDGRPLDEAKKQQS